MPISLLTPPSSLKKVNRGGAGFGFPYLPELSNRTDTCSKHSKEYRFTSFIEHHAKKMPQTSKNMLTITTKKWRLLESMLHFLLYHETNTWVSWQLSCTPLKETALTLKKGGGGTHCAESGDPLFNFLLQHMKTCCRLNVTNTMASLSYMTSVFSEYEI